MDAFCFIVRNINRNIDENTYWNDTITLTYKFFISHNEFENKKKQLIAISKLNYMENIKPKYLFLNQILTNIFLNSKQREQLLSIFSQSQKTYFAFVRLAYIYKFKKSHIVVEHDLTLNPLNISNKHCFCLLQNNSRYLFHVNDLINITNTALSNSPSFFADPLVLKNPYNNVPFNKSTLYNIYFFICNNTDVFSELLHLFFISNFNISLFTDNYEHIIREYAVKYFVKNSSDTILQRYIFDMLDEYNSQYNIMFPYWSINIDIDFPKNKLVNIMRPYLLLYMRSHYSIIHTVRAFSKSRLKQKLDSLHSYNPSFGRKKIIGSSSLLGTTKYVFDDNHPKFIKTNRNFLNTHHEKIISQRGHYVFGSNNINVHNDEYDEIDDEEYMNAFENIRVIT
jgi:hypothetical protein